MAEKTVMGIEGQLDIQLTHGDKAVRSVSIMSSRPVHASDVFVGKSIAESQKLIPLMFSICGTAQSCAGVRACEQALGIRVATHTEQMRDTLVNMESLREHLWRILLEWPTFTAARADKVAMAQMVSIEHDYQQALCPGSHPFQIGSSDCLPDLAALNELSTRIDSLMHHSVFSMPVADWLAITGQQAFFDWTAASGTIAAVFVEHVIQSGWSHSGSCESEALPGLVHQQLHKAMQQADFISQPQWGGHCCETTSLTRCDSSLLKRLKQEHGNGLLVRLVARLTEIARLAEHTMKPLWLARDDQKSTMEPDNPGIGQATAARGELFHRVGLDGRFISSYQILAPTEWNFHPDGVVTQALCALKGDMDQVKRQASLLINAIDPCVAVELVIIQEEA